jgi:hypothetical protein
MKKEAFDRLVKNLNTQDNRATQDPIYVVEEEETIYGISLEYTDKTVWLNRKGEDGDAYETLEEVKQYLVEADNFLQTSAISAVDAEIAGFERIGVTRRWRLINVHLTDAAADVYIKDNTHRHAGRLRSYVPSQYRCHEFNAVIEALKNGELVLREEP